MKLFCCFSYFIRSLSIVLLQLCDVKYTFKIFVHFQYKYHIFKLRVTDIDVSNKNLNCYNDVFNQYGH